MKTIDNIIELQFKAAGDTQHINNFEDKSNFIVNKLWLRNLVKITIEETVNLCADNADADYNIIKNVKLEDALKDNIEVYVLKESILQVKEMLK